MMKNRTEEQVPLEQNNLFKTPEKTEVSSSNGNPVRYCKCIEKETACKLCKKSEFYNIDWDDVNKSFWRRDFVRRSWFDAHVKIIELFQIRSLNLGQKQNVHGLKGKSM